MKQWNNYYYADAFRVAYAESDKLLNGNMPETKELSALLEKYNFTDFDYDYENWLQNGHTDWFVYGNMARNTTQLVKQVNDILNMTSLDKKLINWSRAVIIPVKKSVNFTINFDRKNEKDDNSALFAYY